MTLEVFYGSATACSDLIQDSSIQLVPLHKERICIEHTNRVQDQIFLPKSLRVEKGKIRENVGIPQFLEGIGEPQKTHFRLGRPTAPPP